MSLEPFLYCTSCRWEGYGDRSTCPNCGDPLHEGGLAVV